MYLFGAGINGYGVIKFLGNVFINVVDNDPQKIGTEFCGYKVISIDEFLNKYSNETVIVAAYSKCEDIVLQLNKNGIFNVYIAPLIQNGFWKNCGEIVDEYRMMELPEICIVGDNPFTHMLVEELNIRGYERDIKVLKKEEISHTVTSKLFITDTQFTEDSSHGNNCVDLTEQRLVYKKELEGFKGIHKGERCFIIGNGPSLREKDLHKLKQNGEICFGCNRIFEMCKKTDWRPDYYTVADYQVWRMVTDLFTTYKKDIKIAFIADFYFDEYDDYDKCIRFNLAPFKKDRGFSNDAAKVVYSGGNVVYSMIQIATFMGFESIYLLGVDCNNLGHFYDSKKELSEVTGSWDVDTWMESYWQDAFSIAKKHANNNFIKIYNATRGGDLEAFERVDFDSLDFLK